jgi:RNA-directed DNA polymerase
MPIGNLTSQIFANIYLNELDRFVKHKLKVKYYLRYGDDFILVCEDLEKLKNFRTSILRFLEDGLKLNLNPRNDKILKSVHGLRFLGVMIWPNGRKLKKRNRNRIKKRLNHRNISSYYGLALKHGSQKTINEFVWLIYSILNSKN